MTSDQLMTVNKDVFSQNAPAKADSWDATGERSNTPSDGVSSMWRGLFRTHTHAWTYTHRPERSAGPPSTVSQWRFCSALLTERIPPLRLLLKNVVWLCARNRFGKGQRAVHPSQERRGKNRPRQIWHFPQRGYKISPEPLKAFFPNGQWKDA